MSPRLRAGAFPRARGHSWAKTVQPEGKQRPGALFVMAGCPAIFMSRWAVLTEKGLGGKFGVDAEFGFSTRARTGELGGKCAAGCAFTIAGCPAICMSRSAVRRSRRIAARRVYENGRSGSSVFATHRQLSDEDC